MQKNIVSNLLLYIKTFKTYSFLNEKASLNFSLLIKWNSRFNIIKVLYDYSLKADETYVYSL